MSDSVRRTNYKQQAKEEEERHKRTVLLADMQSVWRRLVNMGEERASLKGAADLVERAIVELRAAGSDSV